jgi:hypothetical protein
MLEFKLHCFFMDSLSDIVVTLVKFNGLRIFEFLLRCWVLIQKMQNNWTKRGIWLKIYAVGDFVDWIGYFIMNNNHVNNNGMYFWEFNTNLGF